MTNVVGVIALGGMYVAMIGFVYYLIVDTKRNLERRYGPYTDADVDKFMRDNESLMDDLSDGGRSER